VFEDKYTLYGKSSVDAPSFEYDDEFFPPHSYDHMDRARPGF
jgi:hypothetical protein